MLWSTWHMWIIKILQSYFYMYWLNMEGCSSSWLNLLLLFTWLLNQGLHLSYLLQSPDGRNTCLHSASLQAILFTLSRRLKSSLCLCYLQRRPSKGPNLLTVTFPPLHPCLRFIQLQLLWTSFCLFFFFQANADILLVFLESNCHYNMHVNLKSPHLLTS